MTSKGDFTKCMRHDPAIVRALRLAKQTTVVAVAKALESAR